MATTAIIACNGPVLALGVEEIVRDAGAGVLRIGAGDSLADVLATRETALLIVDHSFDGRSWRNARTGTAVTVIVCSSLDGTMRVFSAGQEEERTLPVSRADLLEALGLATEQTSR